MLVVLIVLGMVFLIASCFTIRLKWKQETSIVITWIGISLIIYIFGLIDHLLWGIYTIYSISLFAGIYFIYSFIKKKIKWKELFTVGVLLYILLLTIATLLLKNTYYMDWDEFSHWGPNLKAMVTRDVLWANKIYDGVHVVYPPLAGIIEYFFCKINGGFSEEISYMAITSFMITLILPLFKKLQYTIRDIVKGLLISFCIFCLIYIFDFQLNSIYIDLLLGILFAMAMFNACQTEKKEDKIVTILLLIALSILKETGLLLAGIVLMQMVFERVFYPTFKEKKLKREYVKRFMVIILIFIIMLISYGTWKIYCTENGKVLDDRHDKNNIAQIDVQGFIQAATQIQCPEGKLKDITQSFYTYLNYKKIVPYFPFGTAIQLLILFDLIGIFFYLLTKEEEKKRKIVSVFLSMTIGFILYCLVLMATYMFAFTEREGRALASYTRYMASYFIAWAIMMVGTLISLPRFSKIKVFVVTLMICISAMNMIDLVRPVEKNITGISEKIENQAKIIQEKVSIDDKVYLIFQNIGDKVDYHVLRYCISPIVTNLMYEWNLGAPYFEGDIWTYDITVEQWQQKLIEEEFNYVFIAKSDERFIQDYGSIFDEGINLNEIENKVFQVVKTSEKTVVLQEYK